MFCPVPLNLARHAVRRGRATLPFVVLTVFLGAPTSPQASQTQGRWQGPYPLHNVAIDGSDYVATHLAVLRGNADSTIIVYFTHPDKVWVVAPRPVPGYTYPNMPDFSYRRRVSASQFNSDFFCSGHSSVDTPTGGKLLVTGGNEIGTVGVKTALMFDPKNYLNASNGWSQTDNMAHERFYPSQVSLASGKTATFGGTRYWEVMTFGGEKPSGSGTVLTDELIHLELTRETFWNSYGHLGEPAFATGPSPRRDHTATWSTAIRGPKVELYGTVAVYGGCTGATASTAVNEFWVAWRTAFDAEESWNWQQATNVSQATPPKRSEHASVVNHWWNGQFSSSATDTLAQFNFGGLDENGSASDETWLLRYHRHPDGPRFTTWKVGTTGQGPGARYGHTAVLDPGPGGDTTSVPRMLVFGGKVNGGGMADRKVYALTLKPPFEWNEVAGETGAPPARYRHTAIFDDVNGRFGASTKKSRMIVFGGKEASGLLADVWALCRCNASSGCQSAYSWQQWSPTGAPSGRFRHTAVFDWQRQRMIVFGGDLSSTSTPNLTDQVWALPVIPSTTCAPDTVAWQALSPASTPGPRAGHTAVYYDQSVNTRLVEIYDPNATGPKWSGLNGAPKFDRWTYPFLFQLPSGNLFFAGRNNFTYQTTSPYLINNNGTSVLTLSGTPAWATNKPSTMPGTAAVMYRPGKVMKCGLGATSGNPNPSRDPTAWVDLSYEATYTWQDDTTNTILTEKMWPRVEPNLTMLPTGDVLVTGGRLTHSDASDPQKKAQIWNPGTQKWTDVLAEDISTRGYHSTAILLPDGRVMSAGGNGVVDLHDDATIYEPPYLFNSDGSLRTAAQRPQTTGLPAQINPGQVFTVCVASTQNVTSVALVRPGATTHAFNQDQFYVPLSFQKATSGPARLFVTAPGSLNHAPPGDYLLFVVDSTDNSLAGRVPSIGKWITMRGAAANDLCDVTPPGVITDLEPDIIGPSELWLMWTASADDGVIAASGWEKQFLLRRYSDPIDSEEDFDNATPALTEHVSVPNAFGTWGSGHFDGLQPCTSYHVAVRATDDNGLKSGLHPDEVFQTTCGSGGGSGSSATAARPDEAGVGLASSSSELPSYTLVVETRHTDEGGWQVALRRASEADGLGGDGSTIVIDGEDPAGERDTLGLIAPDETQTQLGVCSLRDRGRIAIPGVYMLEEIVARVRHRRQDFTLAGAQHSRLGSLGPEFIASGGTLDLAPGDLIELTYFPNADSAVRPPSWYVLARRRGSAPPIAFSRHRMPGVSLPDRFALHLAEPNPAATMATVRFDLPRESLVRLEVFDLLGRRVATIAAGVYPAGTHAEAWALSDDTGARLRPGVYVCRLIAGEFRAQRKLGVLP